MSDANHFNSRSTADQVLAGIDLSGKRYVVTGCNSGIGFETMNALAANGADVFGLARSRAAAEAACKRAGPGCSAVECDLSDLASVAAAAQSIRTQCASLDAIVANAGIAALPTLQVRYGVEMQFLVNHIAHFALVDQLHDIVREGSGRIVVVSSKASVLHAPPEGIRFDNLDGHTAYRPLEFYGQSKLAVALFASELSRRVAARGICVNSVHPGATRSTGIHRHRARSLTRSLASLFMRNPHRGAATQTLLAANPHVANMTGEYWTNCRVSEGHARLRDVNLARRLWEVSHRLVQAHGRANPERIPAAA